jgi:hypothetical protein
MMGPVMKRAYEIVGLAFFAGIAATFLALASRLILGSCQ